MIRSYKIEGIVIKRINLAEADRLLTIFSKKKGKIVVLAKGVRKIHSHKSPHLELFTHIIAYIVNGKSLDIISEVCPIHTFSTLRTNLSRVAYAYRVIEEVDRLCPEREEYTDIFELLLNTLIRLNSNSNDPQISQETFTLQLLWELGYLPKDQIFRGVKLDSFLLSVLEKKLKSDSLLTSLPKSI